MRLAVVVALAGCGRIGFGSVGVGTTGSPGARSLMTLSSGPHPSITGENGEVVATASFQGTIAVNGEPVVGKSMYISSVAAWFDNAGALVSTAVLDSDGFCDLRSSGMLGSGDALVVGLSKAGLNQWGACDVGGGVEDPVAIEVDRHGNQTLVAHWPASGQNAQGWFVVPASDGTMALSGVYGSKLAFGSQSLPVATRTRSTSASPPARRHLRGRPRSCPRPTRPPAR